MLIAPPAAKGVANVMVPADTVEFNPPPLGWVGGASSVSACTVQLLPGQAVLTPVIGTLTGPEEVRTRRSATPTAGGKVVIFTMRKRTRVTGAPVLFVNVRRSVNVPKVELLTGSGVRSRARFGDAAVDTAGSIGEIVKLGARLPGASARR